MQQKRESRETRDQELEGDSLVDPDARYLHLRLVGSMKLYVFFAKEPYETDDILTIF